MGAGRGCLGGLAGLGLAKIALSCHATARQAADAAGHSGLAAVASRGGFYAGLAAGTLLGGLFLARHIRRVSHVGHQKTLPSSKLPTLPPLARVEPVAFGSLGGHRCAACRVPAADKRGAWYRLDGGYYCQDCAQEAARKGKVRLAVPRPTPARTPTLAAIKTRPKVRVSLKPGQVDVGLARNLAGYTVHRADGRETGLSLTPSFKVGGDGQVRPDGKGWFVTYSRAGQPVAGPYRSVDQARRVAAHLAAFDWTKPPEAFTPHEVQAVAQVVKEFRAEVEFRQYMAGLACSEKSRGV